MGGVGTGRVSRRGSDGREMEREDGGRRRLGGLWKRGMSRQAGLEEKGEGGEGGGERWSGGRGGEDANNNAMDEF